MKLNCVIGLAACLCAGAALAQESLVGKYTGNFTTPERGVDVSVGLAVEIKSVEEKKVKAAATRSGGAGTATRQCAGNYELEGTVSGDKLTLRSTSGPKADCTMTLRLVADGNKLKGQIGSRDVELTK